MRAEADINLNETGTKSTDTKLAAVPVTPHDFHDGWN